MAEVTHGSHSLGTGATQAAAPPSTRPSSNSIATGSHSTLVAPSAQVFARCGFCSHPLVTNGARRLGRAPSTDNNGALSSAPASRGSGGGNSGHGPRQLILQKASRCPNPRCKKPLPRCAVCQQYMGCPDPDPTPTSLDSVGGHLPAVACQQRAKSEAAKKAPSMPSAEVWHAASSNFSHWMVWCQSCRHGGHAAHLHEWFEHHTECPVAGCGCKCALLDGGIMSP